MIEKPVEAERPIACESQEVAESGKAEVVLVWKMKHRKCRFQKNVPMLSFITLQLIEGSMVGV